MSGERTTRELAYLWLQAVRRGGLAATDAFELTTPDFRLHLPRSMAALVEGAGHDLTRNQLEDVDRELRSVFDVDNSSVAVRGYDIFQGDRGGLQAMLNVRAVNGPAFDVRAVATFQRDGNALAAVWIHADTLEVKQRLSEKASA